MKNNYPTIHQQGAKMWFIYTMECYTAMGMNELQLHTIIWLTFKYSID